MSKYEKALYLIDAAHAEDPRRIISPSKPQQAGLSNNDDKDNDNNDVESQQIPYELHYANQMTNHLRTRLPTASEYLHLAIRAQHLRRWEVPRSSYPLTKPGYYAWRGLLARRQADIIVGICTEAGYTDAEAKRVGTLVRKEGLRKSEDEDGEVQVLEDVACLVFLEGELEGFEKGVGDEGKVVDILRKTWGKMSGKGRELAVGIASERGGRIGELVEKALSGS